MIIAIASFKGGVGKTTTAIHLAAYFQNDADTVLIDADPNRSATAWAARGDLPFDVVDEWQPARMKHYGHVIIDTQARPIPEDLAIIADTCELIILPTTPDILALDALTLTLEYLHAIDARRYRVLITIIPPKPSKDGEQTREMLNAANIPVFHGGIRRLAAFHKAASSGKLIYEVKDVRSPLGWEDYTQIGDELLGKTSVSHEDAVYSSSNTKPCTLVLLVGMKGAGKTFIGSVLENYLNVKFLRIEPLFLDLMQSEPLLKGMDLEYRGFQIVLDHLDALAKEHAVLCIESTGAALTFTDFLTTLQQHFQVILIRVQAPLETCIERVMSRDQSAHIPVSDHRLQEINERAAQVSLPWDLVIDNSTFQSEEAIAHQVRAVLP
jgi:chromosome partitioning protein